MHDVEKKILADVGVQPETHCVDTIIWQLLDCHLSKAVKCMNGFIWAMTLKLAGSFSQLFVMLESTPQLGLFLEDTCDAPKSSE